MTKRQKKLYDFIIKYIGKHEIAPSYIEMIKHMGLAKGSKSVIFHYLTELEKEGVIKRIPAKWRGIKINERRKNTTAIQ